MASSNSLDSRPNRLCLEMEGISKRFGPTIALDDVNLKVRRGEVHALVGENGAGKSTLMKILSGAYQADSGRMFLNGSPYAPKNPLDGRTAGVAMIYQELALTPHLSVAENIFLGAEPGRGPWMDWPEMSRKSRQAMEQVGLEGVHPDLTVSRLSVGQQQLVEIARAVSSGFLVLVLDEPTSSLSEKDRSRLFQLIRRLKEKGHAIVYISHFLEEVREVGDRFTVLRDGKTVGVGDAATTAAGRITAMMVGREIETLYPKSRRRPGEVVLKIEELAGRRDLRFATLELRCGEVLGIAGLVGAGRTELLRTIFGLEPVRSGRVRVGAYLGPGLPSERWLQGAGMVSEDRKEEGLAVSLSVADNMTLTRLTGMGPLGLVFPSRQALSSRRWIRELGIRCQSSRQKVDHLSGGNQQKVAIARLLHHDADILLLDEPTRGIDVGSKADIYALIDSLATGDPAAGKRPKAILMVSSYLPELLGVCDRIAVMSRGRLHPARPATERTEHEIMQEATGSQETL